MKLLSVGQGAVLCLFITLSPEGMGLTLFTD